MPVSKNSKNWLEGTCEETIESLVELMKEQGVGSLSISEEKDGTARKVSLTLAGQGAVSAPASAPVALTSPPEHGAQSLSGDGQTPDNAILSPMVGTVYLAPEPGADAFVRAGGEVAEGDTILIIEAMKVMNPLPAPRAGKVVQILVSDGQPVEYGQPLLVIE